MDYSLKRDLNKALVFLQNALAILHGIEANHVHAKYKSAILHLLSVILRLKGRFAGQLTEDHAPQSMLPTAFQRLVKSAKNPLNWPNGSATSPSLPEVWPVWPTSAGSWARPRHARL